MIELEVNLRQQNDSSFSEILNRIRTGVHTNEDVKVLQTRLVSGGTVDLLASPFDTALTLYPRTVDVDGHHEMQIKSLAKSSQIYSIDAEHAILESRGQIYANIEYNEVPKHLIPKDDKDCAALPRILKLAVGARVMLQRNINCGDGLVNGARGTIVGFKWPRNTRHQNMPGELPTEVYVRFLDPNVGKLSKVPVVSEQQDVVPIQPISAHFCGKEGTLLQRTQIPLILCWAATIHKVQGLSLDAAVMDLGKDIFEPGMAYVALSRVRTLNGVALLNFQPKQMTANKRVLEEMARLRQESAHSGEESEKEELISSHFVQNCSQNEEKSSAAVKGSSALVHNGKCMSQWYVKIGDKGTHGKEHTSEPLVDGSQSVHSDIPITYVDTLVLSLKTILEAIVTSNTLNSESIVRWSKCHHSELQTILKVVNRPSQATFSNMHHQVDVAVKDNVFPAFTSQYMPVSTKGGGNCMYHILSLALCGTEQYMCHLRLVTAYSLIVHQQHMLKLIQPTARILLPLQKRDAASVAKAAEVQWLELLRSSITDKSWGNQFHLHALAMILGRSIWLYGVMHSRCLQDEGKQLQPIKQDVTPTECKICLK